jgi:AraC family transcriptional regulator
MRDSTLRSHHESVERVIEAMRNQIDQPLTLQQMARIGTASPYHFNRTFRQVTGVPPFQFLYALRLDAAKRLLTETQKKVIDICYEVGYNSVGTFTRRFADVLGVSPTRLRKLARANGKAASPGSKGSKARTREKPGASVSGYVAAMEDFQGVIAIGLFATPIPQGKPVSCALIESAGDYSLQGVGDGEYYLFAVGLPPQPAQSRRGPGTPGLARPVSGSVCFDYATALRGGGQPIKISRGVVAGDTALYLRPPSPVDPPVLLVVPRVQAEVM